MPSPLSSAAMSELDNSEGILVYTDGSAYTRDRTGGWAYVAIDAFDALHEDSGFVADTTISVMELQGPTEALNWLYATLGASDVLVLSDSEYVVKGFNDKRRARNKNKQVWKGLEAAAALHTLVAFEHVKGHNDNFYNERADVLAGAARKAGS